MENKILGKVDNISFPSSFSVLRELAISFFLVSQLRDISPLWLFSFFNFLQPRTSPSAMMQVKKEGKGISECHPGMGEKFKKKKEGK